MGYGSVQWIRGEAAGIMCLQDCCSLAAEVVFAPRADGAPLPQCPVTVTDRGNGTHELSFVSSTVRSSSVCDCSDGASCDCHALCYVPTVSETLSGT